MSSIILIVFLFAIISAGDMIISFAEPKSEWIEFDRTSWGSGYNYATYFNGKFIPKNPFIALFIPSYRDTVRVKIRSAGTARREIRNKDDEIIGYEPILVDTINSYFFDLENNRYKEDQGMSWSPIEKDLWLIKAFVLVKAAKARRDI